MTTIKIMTCDQVLSFVETPVIACGDVKTVQMVTSTCPAWEGYALSAVFYTDLDKTPYEVLLTDGMCVVPHEVLSKCTTLHIGIRGVNDDEVKTSAILDYKIIEGTPSGIETTAEPTPSVYQQIITTLNSTTKTADSAAEQAENNAEAIEELQESVNNFTANNGTIQEVIDARTGSLVKHTFPNLSTRLNADFSQCITQGELEHALSSVTTKYTEADKVISAQTEQIAKRDYVGRFWRDEAGNICGEVFNDYKNNVASGDLSAANGSGTISTGEASMTWGKSVEATETCATAWGFWTKASKQNSTAWGASTVADAKGATACGYLTIATCEYSFVLGRANVEDTEEKYVVIVGNGNNSTSRANALTLDWNGVLWVSGDITVTGSDNKTVSLMQTNQEIDDAHTGSIVKNTFSSLTERLDADFGTCITQGELEKALSSVTTAYTNADNVQNALLLTAMGLTKGSKNLLKNTASSTTKNGLTFTVNDDGSVMVNGTATADTEITLRNMTLLANTDYILSGCPSGGTGNSYRMYAINTSTWAIAGADYGSSYTLSTGNNTGWSFRIQIKSGYTANDLAFYPMLRYANITDGTFEPYVEDLQSQINALKVALAELLAATATE